MISALTMKDFHILPLRQLHRFGALLALAGYSLAAAAETIYLNKVAAYRNPDGIQATVKEECKMDVRLPEVVREEIVNRTKFSSVALVEDPLSVNEGYAVIVSIVGLDVARAGWSTSPKFMKIKAVLYRDGAVMGEFLNSDQSSYAHINLVRGARTSCKIAEVLAEDLGKDLASWIRKQVVQVNDTAVRPASR
jgi:hypothetical protein